MSDQSPDNAEEADEEELVEALVTALTTKGIKAESWQSGGDIYVALVELPGKNGQLWGLASGAWGGCEVNDDGDDIPDTAFQTAIAPSDVEAAANFIAERMS